MEWKKHRRAEWGKKWLVIYCWVRGLSSKYICIYGVLTGQPTVLTGVGALVLGAPALWCPVSWGLCPVCWCQCAPAAGLVLAWRVAQRLGARYGSSRKSGRDREQKVCQLTDRGTHRSNLCRHDKVSGLLEGHVCLWCLCTRHVPLR